jgi:hypothetical protein
MNVSEMQREHLKNATRIIKVWMATRNGVPVQVTDNKMPVYRTEAEAMADWAGDGWYEAGLIKIQRAEITIPATRA